MIARQLSHRPASHEGASQKGLLDNPRGCCGKPTRLLWCGHEGVVDHPRQSAERRADTYDRSIGVPTAILLPIFYYLCKHIDRSIDNMQVWTALAILTSFSSSEAPTTLERTHLWVSISIRIGQKTTARISVLRLPA